MAKENNQMVMWIIAIVVILALLKSNGIMFAAIGDPCYHSGNCDGDLSCYIQSDGASSYLNPSVCDGSTACACCPSYDKQCAVGGSAPICNPLNWYDGICCESEGEVGYSSGQDCYESPSDSGLYYCVSDGCQPISTAFPASDCYSSQSTCYAQQSSEPAVCIEGQTQCELEYGLFPTGDVDKCVGGQWVGWESCTHGCAYGFCVPPPESACTYGDEKCEDGHLYWCSGVAWVDLGQDDYCVLGGGSECIPPEQKCEGVSAIGYSGTVSVCIGGYWVNIENCIHGCHTVYDQCATSSSPSIPTGCDGGDDGDTRCSPTTNGLLEICRDGAWEGYQSDGTCIIEDLLSAVCVLSDDCPWNYRCSNNQCVKLACDGDPDYTIKYHSCIPTSLDPNEPDTPDEPTCNIPKFKVMCTTDGNPWYFDNCNQATGKADTCVDGELCSDGLCIPQGDKSCEGFTSNTTCIDESTMLITYCKDEEILEEEYDCEDRGCEKGKCGTVSGDEASGKAKGTTPFGKIKTPGWVPQGLQEELFGIPYFWLLMAGVTIVIVFLIKRQSAYRPAPRRRRR